MKNPKLLPLIILVSMLALESNGQTNQVKFSLIKGADGFSLGKVNAITRDRFGFLWLSDQTNRCIIRYDGAHMERFQYDAKNPDGLGGYYPECLTTDSVGNIWIGFYNGEGLDRYDPVTNKFTHFKPDPNNSESLGNGTVSAVLVDHAGNLWVGTDRGLDMLNTATGIFTHYRNIPGDSTSLSHNIVRAIYEDKAGTIWIGTGFAFSNDSEGGLNRFDRKSGTFTRYLHDPNDVNSLIDNAVRAIYEDSKGNFWVGTRGNGLHLMNRTTGLFERFLYDATYPEKLAAPSAISSISHITFFTEDAAGNFWIGTTDNGVNRYDVAAKKTTHYGANGETIGSFTDNSGWWIYTSPDGLLWMSTQQSNLWQIDIFNISVPFVERTKNGYTASTYMEAPATLWLGTSKGLIKEDLRNYTLQQFQHNPQKQSLAGNLIMSIVQDRKGFIWLGTNDGLSRLDPSNGTFLNYVNIQGDSSSLRNDYILDLLEDNDSVLWVTNPTGLEQLNLKTGKFKTYIKQYISLIFKDKDNILWLGSNNNNGITRFNKITHQIKNHLPGLSVNNYYIDSDSMMWLATSNGLYRYDRPSDSFYPIEESNPSLHINAAVFSIVQDLEGNLWMSSTSGIIKINHERSLATVYSKANGIALDSFGFLDKACIDDDGRLYFTSMNGYYVLDPEKLNRSVSAPTLHFTKLWMEGKVINPGNDGPLYASADNTNEIQLAHNQNTFDVGFTAIDFLNAQQEHITYMLEHYDADWRLSTAENRASYFKVPPGDYIFRIRLGQNEDNKELERSILIHISPPWWRTVWAYGFYGLVFASGVFLIDRVQRRRIRERERALVQERELEQARKIEKAYTELKATQSQLIQSEKMASLGELTAGIAHEIQNPLNFVNNFSEVNKELLEELKEEADKGNLNEVKAIADDVIGNEEKINHHGKRADAIAKGMLQHSRSSSGIREPTDINALADEYLRLAYHGLRAKDKSFNATLNTDFDTSVGNIPVVPQDIGRAILNLITNAFYAVFEKKKAASAQVTYEPTVTVTTKRINDKVEIKVKDNGSGISHKALDKIFQPFFTTKPTGQGTGLGLSLSYDIVKAHGGELSVETKEGEGSDFIILLPVQ